MSLIGCIPSRFAATRFPGKPLTLLCGAPMLAWVLRGCQESQLVSRWLVATDDERIAAAAEAAGVEAVMTDPALPSGTDRVCAAIQGTGATHVINVQGDEPLIDGSTVDLLATTLLERGCPLATLARPPESDEDPADPNRVKVVQASDGAALYFSRSLIPYPRTAVPAAGPWIHVGLYGYERPALEQLVSLPPHPLEQCEGLEQLRALAAGMRIAVAEVRHKLLSVDSPDDVPSVEAALQVRYQI